jgi:hypothetical protein
MMKKKFLFKNKMSEFATEEKDQIVYVRRNETMPGYIKIGQTRNLDYQVKSLNTTSVPLPFECI